MGIVKKILLVDDSALMRRVVCDIIDKNKQYLVEDQATNGLEAIELLEKKSYDIMLLDVYMPKMNGIELLRELRNRNMAMRILMLSSLTVEGARVTKESLQLGAMDFVYKPGNFLLLESQEFKTRFLTTLDMVINEPIPKFAIERTRASETTRLIEGAGTDLNEIESETAIGTVKGKKIVCIASSTGGPAALKELLFKLSPDLDFPIVIVQHMPVGFTYSFAKRLNQQCNITVKEAEEGEILANGCIYIAKGGKHLNICYEGGVDKIKYTDEPTREGVKPCANYMFESLVNTDYEYVLCVVLTGMGSDGTEGILWLDKSKKIKVLAQDEESSVIYGMPKHITEALKLKKNYTLLEIANEINQNTGRK